MCEHGKLTSITGDASGCREAVAGGAFLDQIVQQMPAGVVVAEAPSGRLLLANRRAVAVHGPPDLPQDWPSRMAALDARHPDGRPYAENEYPLTRALGGEVVTAEEIDIRRGDGSRITISVNAAPVRDRTGAIALAVLAFDDVSERRQADVARRESEARYRALFEQMSEGFALHEIICDESGQPYDYRILDINPAFERLTGFKREDVVGRTFREVLPDEDPYWLQAYGSVALTGQPLQIERYAPTLDRYYSVIAYRPAPRQFAVVFMDVTDRHRMEESVRVNLTKYSVLFNSLPLGVTVSAADGRVLESNAEAARILGLGSEEHARRTIGGAEWRIVRPDGTPMPPEEFASVRALKERRRVADVEMGIVKEQDEITWISVTAEPLPLEGYGVVIAYSDITDHRQAEAAVRESERRYRELVENANSAIIRWKPDGTITFFNEFAQDLFGYREEEVVGRSVQLLVPETESTGRDLRHLLNSIVQHPQRYINNVNENLRRDGTRCWMTWTNKAIRDENGEVVEVLAVGSDITDLRKAEDEQQRLLTEVERERTWLEAILQNTGAHLAFLDRDFNFLRVNRAYAEACRRKPEAFLGRNHFDLFPHAENEAIFRRVRDTGEPFSIKEKPFEHPDTPDRGTTYWDWTLVPIANAPGEVEYLVLSLMDVTEQVRQRERLVASERARAELAETLVSEIGHRTKNNLAIVAGLLQIQLNREQPAASAAGTINDAITRIMSFAALHEQMYQSRTDSVELLDALRRIAEINRRALGAEGASISVEGEPLSVSPGLGTNICVMANELLTNALKHGCPPGGRCEIRVTLSAHESQLALSVWNAGNPVPEDLDIQSAARTGLGLVQAMAVEQYGGSFTLAPHRGGTLASVVLDKARLLEYP